MLKLLAGAHHRARALGRRLRLFSDREDGSVAIEYVVLGPIYLLLLLGIFEVAIISMSMTSVRLGLDDVSRLVRTGQAQCVSDGDVRDIVCRTAFGASCANNFTIERSVYSAGGGSDAVTVDDWEGLNADDIVLLTASYDWPLINPLLDPILGRGRGAVPIRGSVVFKSESFANVSCN